MSLPIDEGLPVLHSGDGVLCPLADKGPFTTQELVDPDIQVTDIPDHCTHELGRKYGATFHGTLDMLLRGKTTRANPCSRCDLPVLILLFHRYAGKELANCTSAGTSFQSG